MYPQHSTMRVDIVTLFPDFFRGPFDHGILQRALREEKLSIHTHDLRAFTHDRHRTVDDRPFGGGEGMVLKPEPIFECVESLGITPKPARDLTRESVILLSAGGRRFTQADARHLASLDRIVLICGRYEGVDERVPQLLCDRELSIGDFVLSGGELAAAVLVDAVTRLLPGVLGHPDSAHFESFGESESPEIPEGLEIPEGSERAQSPENPASRNNPAAPSTAPHGSPRVTHASGGLLDYPHYTRPAIFRGISIPEALASGDHQSVRAWRRRAALQRTLRHRPDLLVSADLSPEDRKILSSLAPER